jgi:hypothetical protein
MSDLLPKRRELVSVTNDDVDAVAPQADHTFVTGDHEIIRRWASRRQAEPATGESTASGSSTVLSVNDGGTGLRFNFPGAAPFRPISWVEWFEHFDSHDLVFAFDDAVESDTPSAEYRLVSRRSL